MNITTTEIVAFLSAAFEAEHGIALHHDRVGLWRLMEAADDAREKLAVQDSVTVNLPCMYNQTPLNVCVSRAARIARRKRK